MQIDYRKLSLAEIAADLQETLRDLYFNAGERHLEPLVLRIGALDISEEAEPSVRLIELMEELYEYDADLRNPRAQELMSAATDEIVRNASAV